MGEIWEKDNPEKTSKIHQTYSYQSAVTGFEVEATVIVTLCSNQKNSLFLMNICSLLHCIATEFSW